MNTRAAEVSRPNPIDFSLYLISDRQALPKNHDFLAVIEQALLGGVDAVQLRDKDLPASDRVVLAHQLRVLTRRYQAQLIINGSIDMAQAVEADGVHLGASSLPIAEARRRLGPRPLIGYSAHTLEELMSASEQGADFATFSPVFFTPSKAKYGSPQGLEQLAEACQTSPIPIFALGGVTLNRVPAVCQAGARGIALISAILSSAEPRRAARALTEALGHH